MNTDFSKRFYTDFYDSVNQRKWLTQYLPRNYHEEDLRKIFLGRLRLDILLNETLVLTDSQILDGIFFLQQSPLEFLSSLTRNREKPLPIEIRSRCPRLEDSFVSLVKRKDSSSLRQFSFSCVDEDVARINIQFVLGNTHASQIDTWRDIAKIIRAECSQPYKIDHLIYGWSQWIEAQDSILSGRVVKWSPNFYLDDCLNGEGLINLMITEEGKEEARKVLETKDRSFIDNRITELNRTIENLQLKRDLKLLESGFNYAYNLAIARQHGCRTFESIGGSYQHQKTSLEVIDNTTPKLAKFESSADIILRLGEMPIDQFQALFQQNEPSFYKWWTESDHDALKRGFEPFLNVIYEASPSKRLTETFTTALLEIAGLGVGGPLSASIKAVCQIYVIDQLRNRFLPGKKHMANRIISYAIAREDLAIQDISLWSHPVEPANEKDIQDMRKVQIKIDHAKVEKTEEILAYSDPENHWVKVYFDKVKFPNGESGRYNRIIENNETSGVAIVPIFNNMVCLVKQYRYPIGEFAWEIPRGFAESKDYLQEAMRELYEETGISIYLNSDDNNFAIYDLGHVHPNSGLLTSKVKLFAVVCLASQTTFSKDNEVSDKRWFPISDLLLKIRLSKITDSFTITALFKANLAGLISW